MFDIANLTNHARPHESLRLHSTWAASAARPRRCDRLTYDTGMIRLNCCSSAASARSRSKPRAIVARSIFSMSPRDSPFKFRRREGLLRIHPQDASNDAITNPAVVLQFEYRLQDTRDPDRAAIGCNERRSSDRARRPPLGSRRAGFSHAQRQGPRQWDRPAPLRGHPSRSASTLRTTRSPGRISPRK